MINANFVGKRKIPKYKQIKKELQKRIQEMKPGENKLDTEVVLAAEMDVSVATVRQAMDELISTNLITRIQGKGVFGRPHVSRLPMRIDRGQNFRSILAGCGYRVSVTQKLCGIKNASSNMIRRLPDSAGKEVFSYNWTYYADDTPVIICRIEVPIELALYEFESEVPPPTLKESLRELCGQEFTYTIAWTRPAIDTAGARTFAIPDESPLLAWDEVFYSLADMHICYNEILFNPGIIDFAMVSLF